MDYYERKKDGWGYCSNCFLSRRTLNGSFECAKEAEGKKAPCLIHTFRSYQKLYHPEWTQSPHGTPARALRGEMG